MGYTTDFRKNMTITKNILAPQAVSMTGTVNTGLDLHQACALINGLAGTRRMKRDLSLIADTNSLIDGVHYSAYGTDGEFYFGTEGFHGQSKDASVINYNQPSSKQPALWLQWTTTVVDIDTCTLEWDGGEKFYSYAEWLQYIIDNILTPNNLIINGAIHWEGEDRDDIGTLCCVNNVLTVVVGVHTDAFTDAELC